MNLSHVQLQIGGTGNEKQQPNYTQSNVSTTDCHSTGAEFSLPESEVADSVGPESEVVDSVGLESEVSDSAGPESKGAESLESCSNEAEVAGSSTEQILESGIPQMKLECDECAFGFDSVKATEAHFSEFHLEANNEEESETANPKPSWYRSTNRRRGHGHPHKCYVPECNLQFGTIPEALVHIQTDHQRNPHTLVSCRACGQLYPTMYRLHRHQQALHPKHPQCNICTKKFKDANAKKAHLQAVHNVDEDSFKCTECGQAIVVKSIFEAHVRVHEKQTGRKLLFSCGCLQTFMSQEKLDEHKAVAHNRRCDTCGLVFDSNTKLQRHLISHPF